ncbi:unnamed protein product [Adineta steineri]|uniref:Micro-fibrillar-associated protein 1 C-terminal domain-containing protein n=1 Tax=Adineta steineri TaxID=433720 RepID=A0A815AY57_9BILA|nr:unnamed protein product [Adineta steineri]CAF3792553.1 unnamed protein product [Adineta steineri]
MANPLVAALGPVGGLAACACCLIIAAIWGLFATMIALAVYTKQWRDAIRRANNISGAGDVQIDNDDEEEQQQPKASSVTCMEQEDRRLQAREIRKDDDDTDRMDLDDKISNNHVKMDIESPDDDEEEIERRRQRLLMKAKENKEEELLPVEDENEFDLSEESESEKEDDVDSIPRLKPVFVENTDRRTIAERKAEEKYQIQLEIERKCLVRQRKMETKRIVEEAIKQEAIKKTEEIGGIQCDFDIDDEDGKVAYDAWKLRELERLKRDRK